MFPHFLSLIVVLLQLAFVALIVYLVLKGIRWAVANGIRDAQKMAERDRLAAMRETATPSPPGQDASGTL